MPAPFIGIGLRQPHYREVFERQPGLGFVEVHSENFFLAGGASMHALERARACYPVSLHGVGLSLGSADALTEGHLAKLKRLVDRIEPALVSEHLCWGGLGDARINDLLPMPRTREALELFVARVDRVQAVLGRQILIENVSEYIGFIDSEFSEMAFLAALAARTGCGILLDINNLYVNAINHGFDPTPCLEELSGSTIGEMHLAGHTEADGCLIDTHGSRVCAAVWGLYAEAIDRFGPVPTLIEWDTDLPALDVLLGEAQSAARIAASAKADAHV
ncbi:DUF692 domain-containing protein [soil metagenome]